MRSPYTQRGFVWMLCMVLLAAVAWRGVLNQPALQRRAQQHNAQVLAQAKAALLAYASEAIGQTNCEKNCPRPGDLPCPDTNNDGGAETFCNTESSRFGRLPWKTLGLGDLRDAAGERLWYAVSEAYKNNTRVLPLNVDTMGSLSLRDGSGQLPFDATQGNGVVALVIAPMHVLLREDGLQQQRTVGNQTQAAHYLDLAQGEDNATFRENSQNGWIASPVSSHFNDVLLPITSRTMHEAMQQRVLAELRVLFKCQSTCPTLPAPAAFDDKSCLGAANLLAGQCLVSSQTVGRLPLDSQALWPLGDSSHPLSGLASHHWFQQNGWRELVLYQPKAQSVTLVCAGAAMPPQSRVDNAGKTQLGNYIESTTLQRLGLSASVQAMASNDVMLTMSRP